METDFRLTDDHRFNINQRNHSIFQPTQKLLDQQQDYREEYEMQDWKAGSSHESGDVSPSFSERSFKATDEGMYNETEELEDFNRRVDDSDHVDDDVRGGGDGDDVGGEQQQQHQLGHELKKNIGLVPTCTSSRTSTNSSITGTNSSSESSGTWWAAISEGTESEWTAEQDPIASREHTPDEPKKSQEMKRSR